MPDYRRAVVPGATYFFTLVSYRRQPILCNEDVRSSLREAIRAVRGERTFEIDAWVLLPDHMHCIWRLPHGDSDYSGRWARIKRLVTKGCGERYYKPALMTSAKQRRRESTLWQRRFWEHMVRDEIDLNRCRDYLHWNPVKHGYVSRVSDWPYSTFHRFVNRGAYPDDWGGGDISDSDEKLFGE